MKTPVVFTDLDGTLLDHATYAWEPALPALRLLCARNIPVVFCSSKTRTEIEHYRKAFDNHAPFVTENGGGIFLPIGYFDPTTLPVELVTTGEDSFAVIRLGAPYHFLRQAVRTLRAEGFSLRGFGDMSIFEVAELTGLTLEQAAMARERDFDEPFVFRGSAAETEQLVARIHAMGLQTTSGTLSHILGNSDKGVAVKILVSLFRAKLGGITVVALGDSPNDLAMLQQADHPVAVRKPDGSHDRAFDLPHLTKTTGIGPVGWNEAILNLCGGLG